MTDAKELSGRELDFEVAQRVFGWKRGDRYGNGNGEWIEPGQEKSQSKRTWEHTPKFSTDIAAAWQVECEIERRGRAELYAFALYELVAGKKWMAWDELDDTEAFALIHATPEQRCRAALTAVPPVSAKK